MRKTDTPITFTPPRHTPARPRARKIERVAPVIKPDNMPLEEVERALGRASRNFFMQKFQNLGERSTWKQEFMLAVFDILINHSYRSGQMQEMAAGQRMPEAVKDMLRKVKATRRDLKTLAGAAPRNFAPIP